MFFNKYARSMQNSEKEKEKKAETGGIIQKE